MESVIGLRFSTLPSPSVWMPSGFQAARATKPHVRLSHSSLSLPKGPRSLSLGHNSSLSLPQSSGGRPLDHIIGPISCMVDGSLPPTHNRDHRGAANVPRASRFLRNVGWGNRSNHKAKAGSDGGSLQSENDKKVQYQQITLILERLKHIAEAQKGVQLSVEKDRNLYNEIIDTVKTLKCSQKYDLALKLLKAYEPCISDEQSLSYIRFHIMEILCYQKKCREASNYWIQLFEMNAQQIQFKLGSEMQLCILRGLNQHAEAASKYRDEFNKYQSQDDSLPSRPPGQD